MATRTLKRGHHGEDVRAWQEFLMTQDVQLTRPDGRFMRGTHNATMRFQARHGLEADGKVGRTTRDKAIELGMGRPRPPQEPKVALTDGVKVLYRIMRKRNAAGVRVRTSAGALVEGTEPVGEPADPDGHLARAVWLTAQVEGAHWGTVQSYDGAGMSGGLLHNTAIFPASMKPGQLWELVAEVFGDEPSFEAARRLRDAFVEVGWEVSRRGKLLRLGRGDEVGAVEIRRVLTPMRGNPESEGPHWDATRRWAALFHGLLAAPEGRPAQVRYAIDWIDRTRRRTHGEVYERLVGQRSAVDLRADRLPPEVQLALCAYHCFVVNAPGPAERIMAQVLPRLDDPSAFAVQLTNGLRSAGRSNFMKRYRATRRAAQKGQKLGLWEDAVVERVLPA